MRRIVTPDQMRSLEERHMRVHGVLSETLMERAARFVVDRLCHALGGAHGKRCAFACGGGSNGGDGYAAARLFAARGGIALIFSVLPAGKKEGAAHRQYLRALKTPGVRMYAPEDGPPDAWVDAIFGIGFRGEMPPEAVEASHKMEKDRQKGAVVLSVDIPSGVDALTGHAAEGAVRADITATFQHLKTGHFFEDGPDFAGRVSVGCIGILEEEEGWLYWPGREEAVLHAQPRRQNSHKGTYGHVFIIAGSVGMAGAAALCAQGALRAGAGLVTVACPEPVAPVVQTLAPCAMAVPLPWEEGAISKEALPALQRGLSKASSVAIGPGLSLRAHPDVLGAVLDAGVPAVIDADGLNLLSQNRAMWAGLTPHHVLTPHPGEAKRLGAQGKFAWEDAKMLARQGNTALLKGHATLVCGQGRTCVVAEGTPGMATGGSGDVLSGIVAALLARGMESYDAAWMGAYLHGRAGRLAACRHSEEGMTAMDIPEQLGEVYRELRRLP